MNIEPIKQALDYLHRNNADIPLDLYTKALKVGAIKADSLGAINSAYNDAIARSLIGYFEGGSVTGPKNAFKRAMVEAFGSAVDLGWTDAGEQPPISAELLDWFNARVAEEIGHIDLLFEHAKALRKEPDYDYFTWITARATGYVSSVSAVYNAARMFAEKGKLLEWKLGNTEKHCVTCAKLNGTRHRASWYIANNYIPRQPGASMECGGYRCDCALLDRDGNEVTI